MTPKQRPPLERQFLPAALEIIETPAPALPRAIIATIVAAFLLAIAWASIGMIDMVAIAPGKIISADRAADQLWLREVGTDLEASIIGTADRVKVQGWYGGNGHAVEHFKTSDGVKTLLESQVQGLVSAMAALSATPPATTRLPTDSSYNALRTMIATNWQ